MTRETPKLECLCCGETRDPLPGPLRRLEAGECPRCRYVGWAASVELTELVRRSLRERPLERRHLRAV